MDTPEAETPVKRRATRQRIFGAAALAFLGLISVVWIQREQFADDLIQGQLDDAGIRATYTIDQIGFRTERLRNVVLGDPTNPDLTARIVEVELAYGFGAPTIRSVRAEGVRLRGKLIDGQLRLGELDKYRDLNSKAPFALPDLSVSLKDAVLSLVTPLGGIGVAIDGQGHLQNSFTGRAIVRANRLAGSGCTLDALRLDGTLRIREKQPEWDGPMAAALLDCQAQGVKLAGPALSGKVRLSETLDRWNADLGFAANSARIAGQQFNALSGKTSFYGSSARTDFELKLARGGYRGGQITAQNLGGKASGRIAWNDKGLSVAAKGDANLLGGSASPTLLSGLSGFANSTKATPIGPLAAALEPALRSAAKRFDGGLGFDFSLSAARQPVIEINGLHLTSATGAQMSQRGALSVSGGRFAGPLYATLSGGGLPEANLTLRPVGRSWSGNLALTPYARGGASLSVPELAFTGNPNGGWRFSGQATLTGPLLGGRIEGLSLPVDGSYASGRFAMLGGCRLVRFTRLQTGTLDLPAQSFQACAKDGAILQSGRGGTRFGFVSPSLSARGTLGNAPIAFAGANIHFDLKNGFAASNVTVDLGRTDAVSHFTVATLSGEFAKDGLSGTIGDAAGQIGNVPLLLEGAQGTWDWSKSVLTLNGQTRVSDAEQVDRFNPVTIPDMQVVLADGIISAIGHIHEPKTDTRVADVDIKHTLSIGTGRALFALDGLRFTERFQPELLTPLTLGAIANVAGTVNGDGAIEWDGKGVKSHGKFAADSIDFAAAFGPVSGLATDVTFTDLLNLETAPGQVATIAQVNPGVPAFDGRISYHLLGDQKVQVEGGRWPFYGGELILEPTIIDFDVSKPRNLTFRLVGMDAEKFLAGYDLENLRVSGVFDGTLPMIFDAEGGRIVGGWLVSRPGGGEVSYLGQLSYENMGAMANFAFDALRSIRFDEMQIGVNGNIGGEVVTEVRFRGLQQGSLGKRNFITSQIAKLPIQFNVRIEAEFLQLIGNLRSIYDAEYAAQRYKSYIETPPPVTGEDSDKPK